MQDDIVYRLRTEVVWEQEVGELLSDAAREIERLRFAIRRIAEQDATLSVCEGDVTVTVDAALTDAEREAIRNAADAYAVRGAADGRESVNAATLRGLLARTGTAEANAVGATPEG
jgi:predicted phosphodiesterase